MKAYVRKQFILFFLCGGIATLVNLLSRYLINKILGYTVAIIIAYCLGMIVAFALFKFFVFDTKGQKKIVHEIWGFVLVNMWGMFQTVIVSLLGVDYVFPWCRMDWYPDDVAHFLSLSILTLTSYIGHKYFTFGRTSHATDKLG